MYFVQKRNRPSDQNHIPLTLSNSVRTFLYGERRISLEFNFKVMESVDKFIKETNRFK